MPVGCVGDDTRQPALVIERARRAPASTAARRGAASSSAASHSATSSALPLTALAAVEHRLVADQPEEMRRGRTGAPDAIERAIERDVPLR